MYLPRCTLRILEETGQGARGRWDAIHVSIPDFGTLHPPPPRLFLAISEIVLTAYFSMFKEHPVDRPYEIILG